MPFKYRCLAIIAPVIFILDQVTKQLVAKKIAYGHGIQIIPGFFDLVHFRNTGAAFGMFSGAAAHWREPFFFAIALIAVVVIVVMIVRLSSSDRGMSIVLPLLLGGVFGNLYDRAMLGYVIDFLSFHWRDVVWDFYIAGWHLQLPLEWPAFNVADSAITISMIFFAAHILREDS